MSENSPESTQDAENPLGWGEALEFLRVLWAVDHGLQVVSKRMRTRLGVTGPQRLVIRVLGRMPGVPAGRLARILHFHPSTLTGVLRRLEACGAVTRKEDPVDGRRALLALTAKGREIDAWRSGTVEAAAAKAIARVSPSDLEATKRVLAALSAELAAPEEKAPRPRRPGAKRRPRAPREP